MGHCAVLKQLMDARLHTDEWKRMESENSKLLHELWNYTGLEIPLSLANIWNPVDTIVAERTENLPQDSWVLDKYSALKELSDKTFLFKYFGGEKMGRLLGGKLLGIIIKDMLKKVRPAQFSHEASTEVLHIYSGHDTSILSLMSALNIHIQNAPSFAACVLIELYTAKNNESEIPVVEIQYRNETSLIDGSNKLYPLRVPNCGFSCPLD